MPRAEVVKYFLPISSVLIDTPFDYAGACVAHEFQPPRNAASIVELGVDEELNACATRLIPPNVCTAAHG